MDARGFVRAGHWWLMTSLVCGSLGLASGLTTCQSKSPPLSREVAFVLDAGLEPATCWGVTYFGDPTIVAICAGLPRCDTLHAVKHEMIHVAGLRDHPYDFPPCFNQLRSVEASLHGPCEEEVAWLRQHGLRDMAVRVDDPELASCVLEAAQFWNGVTGVVLFASLNGVRVSELEIASSGGT